MRTTSGPVLRILALLAALTAAACADDTVAPPPPPNDEHLPLVGVWAYASVGGEPLPFDQAFQSDDLGFCVQQTNTILLTIHENRSFVEEQNVTIECDLDEGPPQTLDLDPLPGALAVNGTKLTLLYLHNGSMGVAEFELAGPTLTLTSRLFGNEFVSVLQRQ